MKATETPAERRLPRRAPAAGMEARWRALDSFGSEYYILEHYGFEIIGIEKPMNEIGLIELLWNVQRRIMKRLAPLARTKAISMTELSVLWKAHECGSRRVTALADDLRVPPSTLTGMLDRFVEAGWLERDRDPEDRRAVVMKSTAQLSEMVREMKHAANRRLEKALKRLPPETRGRLEHDLRLVLECLDREESEQ